MTNVLMALLAVVLLTILLYGWLNLYTDHGVEVEVPNVRGMMVEEAESLAESVGMELNIIDSVYTTKVPRGIVIEQTPPAMSRAKRHRYIYVVMNAKCNRMIPLPDVLQLSYRQATATLEAMGLRISNIVYQPYDHRDIVIGLTLNGRKLNPGERVEEGSSIVLIVGSGTRGGTHPVVVPDLRGKTLEEAKALLEENELQLGAYEFDEQPTDDNIGKFVVYTQSPLKGSDAIDGDEVMIMLTRNLNRKLQEFVESQYSGATEEVLKTETNNQDSIDDEWF
ncbi:MAG: PASTA domain-containing protein [Paludibacteraceae bacterium]|nr:PASTA domain-containing protein [Paludibacteraceae bacterium]